MMTVLAAIKKHLMGDKNKSGHQTINNEIPLYYQIMQEDW